MSSAGYSLRNYLVVTSAYWVFTLTDGALRMMVLLHLYEKGMGPLAIASLFLFYEFFGVVTNAAGGWIGTRFGLKTTLLAGLVLQISACFGLVAGAATLSVGLLTWMQAMSGVAKDLTKMSAKSYVKGVVAPADRKGLMRWVAILTGSKNALKGLGFFLGGWLLTAFGFAGACQIMAGALIAALLASIALLPAAKGRADVGSSAREILSDDARINWLSGARFFLFGARDIWFVLALPVFLVSTLDWSRSFVGGFLALWVIGYGIVQALSPKMIRNAGREGDAPDGESLMFWTGLLLIPLIGLLAALANDFGSGPVLALGLGVFGVVFAFNSAIHSYLIVAFARADKVAMNVGFYYAANAAGRLVGTLLSGWLFQAGGLGKPGLIACLGASLIFVLMSWLCLPALRKAENRALST